MSNFKRTLVTAALPYANGPKHIGHLAGAYLPADIYTRFLRKAGEEVLFVCGSDEHGTAIPIQAQKEGTSPQAIIDRYHQLLKSNFEQLGIAFDIYHRTSDKIHHETASEFFLELYNKGLFTEKKTMQYYDVEKQTFLADRYIKGTCPNCSNPNAYGDQCEKCGKALSPDELINPVSTLSDKTPERKETSHFYLPLNQYEEWLNEWLIKGHVNDWKTNTYGQSKSWIESGLNERAMTRDLDWGVKVPIPGNEGKVLYVWFDAPIGYISATKAFFKELESGKKEFSYPQNSVIGQGNASDWKKWWQDDSSRLIHFIGKDNIVFHCIIFPIMLHANGQYVVPDNVPANEFLNLEGDKMSTSKGWSVEMEDFLADFKGREDVLRYVLTAIAPETKDSDFNWKEFQTRNNSELVAILGNFVNRVMVLCSKYYEGKVPSYSGVETETDLHLKNEYLRTSMSIEKNIRDFKFREALFELMNMARAGNKYLADNEPWKLIKENPERTSDIMYLAVQVCRHLAWWMEAFMPNSAKGLQNMLNIDSETDYSTDWIQIQSGHELGKASHLFTPIEDEVIEAQIQKLKSKAAALAVPESTSLEKPEISFDDFGKMDIRTATVLHAEKVEKADKLLKIELDLGYEKRTVVSGIAKYYKPEEIKGKQVLVLANLAPRKIRGVESKGMILMAENGDGGLKLVSPAEGTENGAGVA